MPALFKNNASALLASSLSTIDTTVVLSAGLGNSFPLPSGGTYFYGTLFDDLGNYEIVKCTARVTDTLTVVRAQDGTNPLEFVAGNGFALRPVAAVLNNFSQLDADNSFTGNNSFAGSTSFSISPSAPTVSYPDSTTKLATTDYVTTAISNIPAQVPAGSVFLLYQASAPTGWTQITTAGLNDSALRIVTSSGGSTGGTTAFSTVFTNQTVSTTVSVSGTSGATTLSLDQIPSHNHSYSYTGTQCGGQPVQLAGNYYYVNTDNNVIGSGAVAPNGGGGSHTHSLTASGSGTSSEVTLNVKYVNIILCSKD